MIETFFLLFGLAKALQSINMRPILCTELALHDAVFENIKQNQIMS